jgi:hypothetical protein
MDANTSTPTTDRDALAPAKFGLAHALVIISFLVTATVLAALKMPTQDILLLLSGAGGIGVTVVLSTVSGSRPNGRLRRTLSAFLGSGN